MKIFGGVSCLVFDFKIFFVVYISFVYFDKIVVLDLDFFWVSYIDGVGSVLMVFGMYFVSCFLVVVGFWMVILVIVNNFVVVINIVNCELEGMV